MRQWRVGTISMGLLLIAFGILLLGDTLWDINVGEILVYGWPIILILIGVEVLLFSFLKKDGRLKFDIFSIFILFLAIMFTFVIYSVQESGILSAVKSTVYDKGYTFDVNETLEIPDNVEEVIIESPNGNISVNGTDSNKMDVIGTIRLSALNEKEASEFFKDTLTIKILGDQAIVRVEQVKNQGWLSNTMVKADLSIDLPKDLYVNTKIINGDIKAQNMVAAGTIDGVNGRISLENAVGDFKVNTVNGEITLTNIDGDLSAKTINGEIKVKQVNGKLTLETTNGEVDVASSTINDWEIHTLNGEITIEIPENADAKISAKSTIGDVDGNIKWDSDSKDADSKLGKSKEATLGSGTYDINLKSQHGEIEVNVK